MRRFPLALLFLASACGGEPAADPAPIDHEAKLAEVRAAFADDQGEENTIWIGRRLGYLGRYDEAIAVYTEGLQRMPGSYRLLRHRGHRRISTRDFAAAVQDLSRAAELIEGMPDRVEPDGLPNAQNKPRSSDHSNIWYHLGLAHYLRGEYERAQRAYEQCILVCENDDMLVATLHWYWMTLRRLGEDDAAGELLAPVRARMDVIENHDYHRLLRLYRGELHPTEVWSPADSINAASAGYGVGNWYLEEGNPSKAREVFEAVVTGSPKAAFGHIAAEADLARMP